MLIAERMLIIATEATDIGSLVACLVLYLGNFLVEMQVGKGNMPYIGTVAKSAHDAKRGGVA